MPVAQRKDQIHNRRTIDLIQIARRLVRQQNRGPWRHRTRQRHALLLAPRHLRGVMLQPPTQAHRLQLCLGPREGIGDAVNLHRQSDIFQGRHGGDQVKGLKHHPHATAPKLGQPVFVQTAQICAQRGDLPRGGPL